ILTGVAAFLKNVWAKEPVLVASFAIAGLGAVAPGPLPWEHRVLAPGPPGSSLLSGFALLPLRDDGNMPDVPSHPQDPQGPSLEWLKRL
ncbi:NADH dehydrogenase [ubiquinone] 1 alpha subcomplex subunit 3, partial [Bos mutus]